MALLFATVVVNWKGIGDRMVYRIIVKTYEEEYVENMYGLKEAFDRVRMIAECDNVVSVDWVNMSNGVIVLSVLDGEIDWVDMEELKREKEQV